MTRQTEDRLKLMSAATVGVAETMHQVRALIDAGLLHERLLFDVMPLVREKLFDEQRRIRVLVDRAEEIALEYRKGE